MTREEYIDANAQIEEDNRRLKRAMLLKLNDEAERFKKEKRISEDVHNDNKRQIHMEYADAVDANQRRLREIKTEYWSQIGGNKVIEN